MIVAFDPGRNVGMAVVSAEGKLLERRILTLAEVATVPLPSDARVIVGDATGSSALQAILREREVDFVLVDERDSSLEARKLYLRDHPPRGLERLLPPGLRSPPGPIDDYAAYALALRYLEGAGSRS